MNRFFAEVIKKNIESYLRPVQDLTISQWSEQNVFLPTGTSARPGKWKTLPYQHGVFEALEDPKVNKVNTYVWSSAWQDSNH